MHAYINKQMNSEELHIHGIVRHVYIYIHRERERERERERQRERERETDRITNVIVGHDTLAGTMLMPPQ